MKSKKQTKLEKKILDKLSGVHLKLANLLFEDEEINHLQDYANTVSIKRLNFNDHGPVHMRQVLLNAITFYEILTSNGILLSLEDESCGNSDDSLIAIICAAFLHDLGMSIARQNHENTGFSIASPIIDRILNQIFPDDNYKKIVVRSLALEGILGHMGTTRIHSLEAGIILVADGCDMAKGRARIPIMISTESRMGDIHKYSSAAVENVTIGEGDDKPIKITITMKAEVGLFQLEEVLLPKINMSPLKKYIELYGDILKSKEIKRYL